jgi:hypothetical protein
MVPSFQKSINALSLNNISYELILVLNLDQYSSFNYMFGLKTTYLMFEYTSAVDLNSDTLNYSRGAANF